MTRGDDFRRQDIVEACEALTAVVAARSASLVGDEILQACRGTLA